MIDIKLLRTDLDYCKTALSKRGIDLREIDEIVDLDLKVRKLTSDLENVKAKIKSLSKEYALAKAAGDEAELSSINESSKNAAQYLDSHQVEFNELKDELNLRLLYLPNFPADDCPIGKTSQDNLVLKVVNDGISYSEFQKIPHWEIAEKLSILDLKNGAKISGSMFPMYRKAGSKLLRALTSLALDLHSDIFEEIRPPTFVKTETMKSTGHLPKFADEAYHMERDDMWAIPTAEVPLTSLGKDEVFKEEELPKYMTAVTACFRREAGAAGSDTRGLLRVHEFDKVEILSYCTKEQSKATHELLLERAENIVKILGLKYRVLDLCTGDIGNSSRRTFDIEVYSPGCDKWLEVSSVSWFGDYQARRANIRYRKKEDSKLELVHTLNGSALAWSRIWPVLIETGHRIDGTVKLPDVLAKYLNDKTVIGLDGNLQ